jgi:LacI family transcriptional regulator
MGDVAVAAGVSKAAVSKVVRNAYGVSPAMRDRVEAAIDRLGYRPHVAARSMRGASFTIGFEIPQLGNDFFTQVLQGAAGELAGSSYQFIIAPGIAGVPPTEVLNALADRSVDGFVAISPEVAPEWLERLAQDVPIVLLGRHDQSVNYDTVTNDDRMGAALVMDHLLELGHRRIAHITVGPVPGVPDELLPHTLRRQVYREVMAARGLEPLMVESAPYEGDAYRVTLGLLSSGAPPTAIFAGNDTLAIGSLRAVAELGLSTAEVSIAGYDGIDLAAHPLVSLTTVDQFGARSGAEAIQLLLERIQEGRTVARHHSVTPALRIRSSTRPIA